MTAEQVAVGAGAATAVLALLGMLWRAGRRFARRVDELVDDWTGQPARPGVPARPGLMERVACIEEQTGQIPDLAERVTRIENELHPNGGASLRDAVNRVDARTARISPDTPPGP